MPTILDLYTRFRQTQHSMSHQKNTLRGRTSYGDELGFETVPPEDARELTQLIASLTKREITYCETALRSLNDALLQLFDSTDAFYTVCNLAPNVPWALDLIATALLQRLNLAAPLPLTAMDIFAARALLREHCVVGTMRGVELTRPLGDYSKGELKQLHEAGIVILSNPYNSPDYSDEGRRGLFFRNQIFELLQIEITDLASTPSVRGPGHKDGIAPKQN